MKEKIWTFDEKTYRWNQKKCHKCQQNLPLSNFYVDMKRKDGYKAICKKCIIEYQRNYRNGTNTPRLLLAQHPNPFKSSSFEYELFEHLYNHSITPSKKEVELLAERLIKAERRNRTFFKELDKIIKEYGKSKSDYKVTYLEEMQKDRAANAVLKGNFRGGVRVNVKVSQYTLEGDMIKTFDRIQDASMEMTGDKKKGVSFICNVCNGRNFSAYGYIWSYPEK